MASKKECSWIKCEREYFVDMNSQKFGIDKKVLNKAIKEYNGLLQKALLGESPYVAEDLRITIARSVLGGDNAREKKDRKSRRSNK